MHIFYLLLLLVPISFAKEVVLSSGLGNYTDQQLQQQYTAFKAYKDMNLITTASMLIYNLNEDGTLGIYNTSSNITSEMYQKMLKLNLGLAAVPCLYCDATIGMCSNFSNRFNNLYSKMNEFIKSTIQIGLKNSWDGFYVDFEPDTDVNSTLVTNFVLEWNKQLQLNGMYLNLWIGGNAPYDDRVFRSNILLTTMNTYSSSYYDFINVASGLQTTSMDITKLGFGLLTNYGSNQSNSDIDQIVEWSILTKSMSLSLWASHINPEWFFALNKYVSAN